MPDKDAEPIGMPGDERGDLGGLLLTEAGADAANRGTIEVQVSITRTRSR